jgi:hypothetical protein
MEIQTNETNLYEEMQRLAMHASVLNKSIDLPLTSHLSNYVVEEEESENEVDADVNDAIAHIIRSLLADGPNAKTSTTSKGFNKARFHYLTHISKALVIAKYR